MGEVELDPSGMCGSELGGPIAGRYRVEERLGRGGAAIVLRVFDVVAGRELALKRLLPRSDRSQDTLRVQFEREYRTLSALRHPSIIEVHDYGIDDVGPYYTMELLRGESLRALGPFTIDDTCRWLRDIASALALLHARRLVHRDVGAANVHLGSDGRARLIDFGALSPFGAAKQIIGTPPYLAPEGLRGSALDGRTDLFALGALAYWMLTGRHAYPARQLSDLPRLWSADVVRPRQLRPEIPELLEQLVLALLSADPGGRPSLAADVIDRLTGLASLDPEPHEAPGAYLTVPALVGRSSEMALLQRAVARLGDGRGSALRISARQGAGKTRMLDELALHAQLRGLVVLTARAQDGMPAFGVARELAARALEVVPDDMRAAAASRVAVVGHALPELASFLDHPPLCAIPENPQEWSGRQQSELGALWLDLARRRGGLVLAVDDVQRVDDASASLLASLASAAPASCLMVVTTSLAGSADPWRGGLNALRRASRRVSLAALSETDVRGLVDSCFGEAHNRERLARWLSERGDGTPLHCMELLRLLLQRGAIRYAGGDWMLSQELPETQVPRGLVEACRARLLTLPARALELATCVSFLPYFTLEHVLSVSGWDEGEALEALDTLLAEGVIRVVATGYGFAVAADRTVLVERLGVEREHALRRALGRRLSEQDGGKPGPERLLEAATHLVTAGDVDPGARMLVTATEQLLHDGGALAQAAPALELAYECYRAKRGGQSELRRIVSQLAVAGYMVDRRYANKYGETAFALLLEETGLRRAAGLSRYVGHKAALSASVLIALARHGWRARDSADRLSRAQAELRACFVELVTVTIALAGVGSLALDREAVERILRGLAPLSGLAQGEVGSLLYRYCDFLHATIGGREADAQALGARIIEQFDDPETFRELRGETRSHWRGGLLLPYGIHCCYRNDDSALSIAERLEAEGFKLHVMFAEQVRMLYHAYRGQLRQAELFRRRVEQHAVQGGTTWQAELVLPASMILPYHLAGEVAGLRRVADQLDQLSERLPSLAIYRDLARALVASLQGDSARARAGLEQVLDAFPIRQSAGWASVRGALAMVLVDCEQYAAARALCLETIAAIDAADRDFPVHYAIPERALARATAMLGDHGGARQQLRALADWLEPGGNPLALGLLHADAVEVELASGDAEAAARHLRSARRLFRETGCPALIARGERLARTLSEAGPGAAMVDDAELAALLTDCGSLEACALRALELLAADVGVRHGRLYLQESSGVLLRAELGSHLISNLDDGQLTHIATEVFATAGTALEPEEGPTETAGEESEPGGRDDSPLLRAVVLTSGDGGGDGGVNQAIATVLLWEAPGARPGLPNPRLVDALGRLLARVLHRDSTG